MFQIGQKVKCKIPVEGAEHMRNLSGIVTDILKDDDYPIGVTWDNHPIPGVVYYEEMDLISSSQ